MADEVHKLPIEVIRDILLYSIGGDKETAAVVSRTCKTVYGWTVPLLYSTVVLATTHGFSRFERALRDTASERQRGIPRTVGLPLGAYVRHLWLGQTRSRQRGGTRRAAGEVPDIWDVTTAIVALCPSLRTVAIINYPYSVVRDLIVILPVTLESLFIRVGDHTSLDLPPDMSRFAALHDITFLQTRVDQTSLHRLLQLPSVRSITRVCDRTSTSITQVWPAPDAQTYLRDSMSQLRLVGEASGTFERMKVASLLDIDSPLEVRLSKLEQYTSEYYAPRASRDPRVVVSAKDERDESGDVDNIKTLYDDWVAGLDPSSLGCVQRTSEHPSWDL